MAQNIELEIAQHYVNINLPVDTVKEWLVKYDNMVSFNDKTYHVFGKKLLRFMHDLYKNKNKVTVTWEKDTAYLSNGYAVKFLKTVAYIYQGKELLRKQKMSRTKKNVAKLLREVATW